MANTKITDLTSGNPAQTGDEIPINRSGNDRKITAGSIASLALDPIVLTEIGDPGAAAANTLRLYSRDNGSGKTQLCVQFPSGDIAVIATDT